MKDDDDQFIEFEDCVCTHASEKAILVSIPESGKTLWIPQSQIAEDSEVWRAGDEGKLVITTWIAEKKGLI